MLAHSDAGGIIDIIDIDRNICSVGQSTCVSHQYGQCIGWFGLEIQQNNVRCAVAYHYSAICCDLEFWRRAQTADNFVGEGSVIGVHVSGAEIGNQCFNTQVVEV